MQVDVRDAGSIPGLGRPLEKGMATHSSILAWKPHGWRAWRAIVHRVAQSQTWLKQLRTKLSLYLTQKDQFSSVAQSCSTLQIHGLQHARPPCPSPTPGVYSNSCSSSKWYHPTISSSVIAFSSYFQSFPASGSFPMSQFFASSDQSIRVSASASVFPMNIQDWSPLGWAGWISLQSKGLSRVFSNTTVQKHHFFSAQLFYSPTLTSIHDYWENHMCT